MPFPVSVYEIRMTFRVPLEFAYRWCTDYSAEDRKLEGEKGSRQIIDRRARTVVYEDLDATPHGWMWSRQTVTLRPPDRWHAEALGNYRTWSLDYRLRALPDGQTEFRMVGRRRATPLGVRNPQKQVLQKELLDMWGHLARAMEQEYRRSRRGRFD
ncbi:MAG: hypothetical protein L3J91_02860 [Thermoplasmata archaeon]|nr:hypothetical protein [Thermoplasmata archaeon]